MQQRYGAMSKSAVDVRTHEVTLDDERARALLAAGAKLPTGTNVVIQFTMFRGGVVSRAVALDPEDTPHELDAVAEFSYWNRSPTCNEQVKPMQ